MEKPEFIAGSEKRFSDFISGLDEKKLALLTHTDLDGVASGRIASSVLEPDILKFLDYTDLNLELIKELREAEVKKIVITDLSITNPDFLKEAEKYFELLIIDHHRFINDMNSEKTVFMNSPHYCAAYLCYYLFSKAQDIEQWDWLAAAASISDWAYFENKKFMKSVLEKHGGSFVLEDDGLIRKQGKFWDLQWNFTLGIIVLKDRLNELHDSILEKPELPDLVKEHAALVQGEIDTAIELFEKERIEISDGYFWEFTPKYRIGSLIGTLVSARHWDKTIIIARTSEKFYNLSARRQDKKVDMSVLLTRLVSGLEGADAGGHRAAAGGSVNVSERDKVLARIKMLKEK